jgi:hypothetical protein
LEQLEELGLLERNDVNARVGSGGYGYCSELPGAGYDPSHVRPGNQWGGATAQIFSEVSPEMHEEYAVKHERRWLERFGLTYYGCCEPLDLKADVLATIANLRKVSVSAWADPARAAENLGGKYVLSFKPNPAIVAEDGWRPGVAREAIRRTLERMEGCAVEIVLKDISTVRREPGRLAEWAQIAVEEAERAAG